MRRFTIALVTAVSSIALTQMATAADLPRKAPAYQPPPPPPVLSWTGCYVGLNAGAVWGRSRDNWTTVDPSAFNDPAEIETVGSNTLEGAGFTGGGQVGCNYQMNAFVFGAEADIQYTGLDESRDTSGQQYDFHSDFQSRWLATFRGRLGWLVNPTVLIYATGGLAIADVDVNDSVTRFTGDTLVGSGSDTRMGWTVGGGAEWMFAPQWSFKAEYLYVDLGNFDTTSAPNANFPDAAIIFNHDLTEHLVRVGVNYHF